MKRRWEFFVRIWWSDQEEPDEVVLKTHRFRWNARLERWFAAPNLGALAFINTLNPEHMVVAVEYDIREAL